MSPMATIWQVARREVTERGRSKAYLITSAVTLLIVLALITLPNLFGDETDEYNVGSVGVGNEEIVDAAGLLGNAYVEEGDPPAVAFTVVPFDDVEQSEAALIEGEVDAVLVDGEQLIVESVGGFGDSPLVSLLQRSAASVELEAIVQEGDETATEVIDIMTSDPLETVTLSGQEAGDESSGLVAYSGLMLLYIAVLLYGTWILSGVTEEKSNRVVEVLLSSVRPWQLLAGKIIGIGLLGIAQFSATVILAVIALQATGTFDIPEIEPMAIFNLILWFILGFLLFAVMFGAAGSLVSRNEDAQSVAFPMSMVAVAGFFVSIIALEDPDGVAAIVGTFVPLTAPFVVPVRASLDALPLWQYVVSVLLTMGTIVGLTFVAGRIYAGALLRFGARTKLREAWRSAAE